MASTFDFSNVSLEFEVRQGNHEDFISVAMGTQVFYELLNEKVIYKKKEEARLVLDAFETFKKSGENYEYHDEWRVFFVQVSTGNVTFGTGLQNQFVNTKDGYLIYLFNVYDFTDKTFIPNESVIPHFVNKACMVFRQRKPVAMSPFYQNRDAWNIIVPMEKIKIKIYEDVGFSVIFTPECHFDTTLNMGNGVYDDQTTRFGNQRQYASNQVFKMNEICEDFRNAIRNVCGEDPRKKGRLLARFNTMKEFIIKGSMSILHTVWTNPDIKHTHITLRTAYDSRVLANLMRQDQQEAEKLINELITAAKENPEEVAKRPIPEAFTKHGLIEQKLYQIAFDDYIQHEYIELGGQVPINPVDVMASYRVTQYEKVMEIMAEHDV